MQAIVPRDIAADRTGRVTSQLEQTRSVFFPLFSEGAKNREELWQVYTGLDKIIKSTLNFSRSKNRMASVYVRVQRVVESWEIRKLIPPCIRYRM